MYVRNVITVIVTLRSLVILMMEKNIIAKDISIRVTIFFHKMSFIN